MDYKERVMALLEDILRELRKFNQTIPLLDELHAQEEARLSLEERGRAKKHSAQRSWEKFQNRKRKNPESGHSPGHRRRPDEGPG